MIKKIKIDSSNWTGLKKRYALSHLVITQLYRLLEKNVKSSEEVTEHAIQELYSMFIDKETDTHKLVEKYELRSRDFFSSLSGAFQLNTQERLTSSRIKQIDEHANKIRDTKSDSEFVQDRLINSPFFGRLNHIRQDVLRAFSNEYQNWRKDNFPNSVKEMVPKFSFNKQLMDKIDDDFSREKENIENNELERICNELEKGHRDG
jgi:transcription termination factor NusB